MCIIVDTDRIDLLLKEPPGDDTRPILRWLWRGHGSIVYSTGGGFSTEVQKRAKARFREWARAGWARVVPAETFEEDELALRADPLLKSEDAHVLALARASGARLLYTGDGNLMDDFRNKRLIDRPRGRIYSRASNADLLTASACRSRRSRSGRT